VAAPQYGFCHFSFAGGGYQGARPRNGRRPMRKALVMEDCERRDHFLAKAREAEDMANKAADAGERDSWQRIAEGYRELVKLVPEKLAL
jgi:hypothetical protein